jgi:hypothetical protein
MLIEHVFVHSFQPCTDSITGRSPSNVTPPQFPRGIFQSLGLKDRTTKITGLPPATLTSDSTRPATPVHLFVIRI